MTLGHSIGVGLGVIAAMLGAFLAAGGTGTTYDRILAAIMAAFAAGSTFLQYEYPSGPVIPSPPPLPPSSP